MSDVLEEVLDYLRARSTRSVAIETLDALVESRGFELLYAPKADFDAGRSLFRSYEQLSLTDAVVAASMGRQGLEHIYSFYEGFDGVEGITRLASAQNPFE